MSFSSLTARALVLVAAPWGPALAQTVPAPQPPQPPLTMLAPGPRVRREPAPPPEHLIAVGFSSAPKLREALRDALGLKGRYLVAVAPQLPAAPGGLFVGGFLTDMRRQDDWVECRARYGVAGRPGGVLRFTDTAAASAAIPQSLIFAGRPELVQVAEESCLEELAKQISDSVVSTSTPGIAQAAGGDVRGAQVRAAVPLEGYVYPALAATPR